MSDDDEWLEPDDQMGLWEHQGQPLTVRWLMLALAEVAGDIAPGVAGPLISAAETSGDLPVEVEFYDGSTSRRLHPMHIDVRAIDGRPAGIVITVS